MAPPILYSLNIASGQSTAVVGNPSNPEVYAEGQGLSAKFKMPRGMTFDELGNLYIVDHGGQGVAKVNTTYYSTKFAGFNGWGYTDGLGSITQYDIPLQIVFDSKGRLFVTDYFNTAVRMINW